MTRLELLHLVVARARSNGFELRRWYTARLGLTWISTPAALTLLDTQRRYYALVFSHEFATTFWKPGTDISFEVPAQTFKRQMPDGSVRTVQRKPFTRRSLRPNAWRYHLREMALAEDPLRYLRKYLHIEEQLEPEPGDTPHRRLKPRVDLENATGKGSSAPPGKTSGRKQPAKKGGPLRPLPTGRPAFLNRPYKGSVRST